MRDIARELEKIADELLVGAEEMAIKVRENGKQSQEGFDAVLYQIKRMHNVLSRIPGKLNTIALLIRQKGN